LTKIKDQLTINFD